MAPKQRKSADATAAPANKTDADAKAGDAKTADAARYAKLIVGLSDRFPEKFEKVKPYVVKAAPAIAMLMVYIRIAIPHIVKSYVTICDLLSKLPHTLLRALIGFTMCFFGGVFPASIAAYEAWKMCGGKEGYQAAKLLLNEVNKVRKESVIDDAKDDDGDGIPDVDQISPQELAVRKAKMVLRVVDPNSVNTQVALLYTGWIGVIAVLKIEFARTITLGNAIGDKLYGPAEHFLQPIVISVCPEEYKQWVPWFIKYTCKVIAVTIAWWIQRILSAVHSCVTGGLMFGRELVHYLHDKGHIQFDADDSFLDEAAGFAIGAFGLLVQFYFRFSVPFPLNILFLPLSMVEGIIVWSVNN